VLLKKVQIKSIRKERETPRGSFPIRILFPSNKLLRPHSNRVLSLMLLPNNLFLVKKNQRKRKPPKKKPHQKRN
jgi:hypothetical protein